MLVLERDLDESINIGDDIEVKILSISRRKVSVGIAAPKDILILRNELFKKIQNANKLKEMTDGNGC